MSAGRVIMLAAAIHFNQFAGIAAVASGSSGSSSSTHELSSSSSATDTLTSTSTEVSCWDSQKQADLCLDQCAPCILACTVETHASSVDSASEYTFDHAAANCRETEDTSSAGCPESQCSECATKVHCIMQDDETSDGAVERRVGRSASSSPSAAPSEAPTAASGSGSGSSGSSNPPLYVKRFDGECKEGSDTLMYSGCYYAKHNQSVNHDDNPGTTPEENIAECAKACSQDASSGFKGFEVIPSTGRCWCSNADGRTCTAISSRRHDGTCTTKDNGAGYERFDFFDDHGSSGSGSSGETCVSAPDYRHPDGENCAEMASYCRGYGNDRGTQEDGRSANQACCECGGSSDFSGPGFSGEPWETPVCTQEVRVCEDTQKSMLRDDDCTWRPDLCAQPISTCGPKTKDASVRPQSGTSDCRFPFIYKNVSYHSCITTEENGRDAPWCATTPNYDTDPRRNWGNCECSSGSGVTPAPSPVPSPVTPAPPTPGPTPGPTPSASRYDHYEILEGGTCESEGYVTILDIDECQVAGATLSGHSNKGFRFDQPEGGYRTAGTGSTRGCTFHNGNVNNDLQYFPNAQGDCGSANFHCVCGVVASSTTTTTTTTTPLDWHHVKEGCACAATWTSPSDGAGCASEQKGCTQCEADYDPWCICANDSKSWAYCVPAPVPSPAPSPAPPPSTFASTSTSTTTEEPEEEECNIAGIGNSDDGSSCVFPFIYKGFKYNGCTDMNNGGVPWCSTTANYDDDKQWGTCASETCPIHKATTTSTSTAPPEVTATAETPPADVEMLPEGKENVGAATYGANSDASSAAMQDGDASSGAPVRADLSGSSIAGVLVGVMALAVVAVVLVVRQKKHGAAAFDEADVMETNLESGKSAGSGSNTMSSVRPPQAAAASSMLAAPVLPGAHGSSTRSSSAVVDYAKSADAPVVSRIIQPAEYLEPVGNDQIYGAATAVEEDIYDTCGNGLNDYDAVTTPSMAPPLYQVANAVLPAAGVGGAGSAEEHYECGTPYRASDDMNETLATISAADDLQHDYVLADEVGVAPDVCYDTATSEVATAWFAEPEYALGANPDDAQSVSSLRMKSVHRTNPVHDAV